LQFTGGFTFRDAIEVIPYLDLLGISHIYASPYLKARAGSTHGYDIVDHNALNPEIGNDASLADLVRALHLRDMGQILDIVPSHMGVGKGDNRWWMDVLENGEASEYESYFDIDWHPLNPTLRHKVLLPFLADHYGAILDRGELRLGFVQDTGSFQVTYFEHLLPIDPRSYPQILTVWRDGLKHQFDTAHPAHVELQAIVDQCKALPRRTEASPRRRKQRQHGTTAVKRQLAAFCEMYPDCIAILQWTLQAFNGTPHQPETFERLHRLLETQAYRLAYWLVAANEINYRRFFDINYLAGIRMENTEVFNATHGLITKMITKGQLDGLRIDHIDGLADPAQYCRVLHHRIHDTLGATGIEGHRKFHVWVEKILARHERLPRDWPIHGTTGYEFSYLVNGLFVYPNSEGKLDSIYGRFTGFHEDVDEGMYRCKKRIIENLLSSELTMLTNLLSAIAKADRHTRDFTDQGLRNALSEVVACFPVYRTYITPWKIEENELRYVAWAIARAKKRYPSTDLLIFDFIRNILILQNLDEQTPHLRHRILQFTQRFQQYTAPVLAKGLEDTFYYVHNRLISLNEVGFDPHSFAVSIAAFHHENRQRLAEWPEAMLTTSTHDSKRGEDVRTRIDVLSEIPEQWRRRLRIWARLNRPKKRELDHQLAPSRNDEYFLYQTLLGSWPLEALDVMDQDHFRARIEHYMIKAAREAKTHTSWINPNLEYEEALQNFIEALFTPAKPNFFLEDFLPFQKRVTHFGLLNSLSQTLLKLTSPGIPDLYQGNELWCFNLVDPDNRRPVDFNYRQDLLRDLSQRTKAQNGILRLAEELLEHIEDGRAKLYITWKSLTLRRRFRELFRKGDYHGLIVQGERADHLCAFSRRFDGTEAITVATRWLALLAFDDERPALTGSIWENTWIELPEGPLPQQYKNELTGETVPVVQASGKAIVRARDVLARFPVGLLSSHASLGQ